MAGMVLAGSFCTIFGKVMDKKVMLESTDSSGALITSETEFKHPLLMNFLMFLGEASLLLVLRYQLKNDSVKAAIHAKNKASPLMFLAPATLDVFASFLQFTALAFISASSYQILKMLQMPFVVVLSIIFLKR